MRHLLLLALVLAPSIPRPTGACSPPSSNDGPHAIDPAFASDTVPPSAVSVASVVERESNDDGGGSLCGEGAQCTGFSPHVYLSVVATDDRAPKERMGYTFTLSSGTLPPGLTLPTGAVLSAYGEIYLRIDGNAPAFDFTLDVRAVDLNGNVGPATLITISDPA